MNPLTRDKRWHIFYGDVSVEQFIEKLPTIRFRDEVPKDVKESFDVVNKLLIHAYYEYLFIDIAVGRALQIFEMALLLRYKELNNGEEWDLTQKPLKKLMGWFLAGHYFETRDFDFIERIRLMRNHLTHPKGHNFGGTLFLQWMHTINDLINELYDDIELRKERWQATKDLENKLTGFIKYGGKLKYMDQTFYIYSIGSLKVDNRLNPTLCFFSLMAVFDLQLTAYQGPWILSISIDQMPLNMSSIDFTWGAGHLVLINDLTPSEKADIADFKVKIQTDINYQTRNLSLLFSADTEIRQIIRNSRK